MKYREVFEVIPINRVSPGDVIAFSNTFGQPDVWGLCLWNVQHEPPENAAHLMRSCGTLHMGTGSLNSFKTQADTRVFKMTP